MVRSSYKNRKKNRKQSFKRRITGGIRDVNFIDDKMVGGNDIQIAITGFMNKYKDKHPIYGVLLGIYSNQQCANVDLATSECKSDNTAQLEPSYKKSRDIMDLIPEVDDKPKALTEEELQKKEKKLEYVGKVIDYLAQNVFIPKGLIKNVHVQNDDGTNWTTLTNKSFNEIKSTENTAARDASVNANEEMKDAAAESEHKLDPEPGQDDEADNQQNAAAAAAVAVKPKGAETLIPFSDKTDTVAAKESQTNLELKTVPATATDMGDDRTAAKAAAEERKKRSSLQVSSP